MTFSGYSQPDKNKALIYFNAGSEKVIKKNYHGAITDLSEAIRLDTGFIQAYENRGVAKYYLQDYNGAIADFTKALEINPVDYNTYGRRGWARFSLHDCNGAIADFTKAIEGNSDDTPYYNIRGQAKYYLQDYTGAIADFNKVIRCWACGKDQKGKAFFWRGLVKIEQGQKAGGCLDLDKAVKLGFAKASEVAGGFCH